VIREMQRGYFPYTPATLSLYGLREAVRMLLEEGFGNVLARHHRLAEGVRRAVTAWGLANLCARREWFSNSLTAVVVPPDADSDAVVRAAASRLNLSLGVGLGRVKGKVFRIGHLGALNELEVLATLAGTELACTMAGIPVPLGAGVTACERFFGEQFAAGAVAESVGREQASAGRTV
jgi:alanine-glyoxylate transaminase/serine-glyoxylate transaminase/serine-pyruvate transaminase